MALPAQLFSRPIQSSRIKSIVFAHTSHISCIHANCIHLMLDSVEFMKDRVSLLFLKSVHPHLKAGVTAVHVVFDNPGLLPETPNTVDNRITSHTSP